MSIQSAGVVRGQYFVIQCTCGIGRSLSSQRASNLPGAAFVAVATLGLSSTTYHCIEHCFRIWPPQRFSHVFLVFVPATCLALGLIALSMFSLPQACLITDPSKSQLATACSLHQSGMRAMILLGDSHADMLAPAFLSIIEHECYPTHKRRLQPVLPVEPCAKYLLHAV